MRVSLDADLIALGDAQHVSQNVSDQLMQAEASPVAALICMAWSFGVTAKCSSPGPRHLSFWAGVVVLVQFRSVYVPGCGHIQRWSWYDGLGSEQKGTLPHIVALAQSWT